MFDHRSTERFALDLTVLCVLIPPIFAEWRNKQPVRSHNGKLTKYLMIGVMIFNTISQLLWMGKWLGCANCGLLFSSMYSSKALVKGMNMAFLIHRAKLVQGMSPVLSQKWFEKILPAMAAGIVVIYIAGVIKSALDPDLHWICVQGNGWTSVNVCEAEQDEDNQHPDNARNTAALAIIVDVVITSFLMVLFVVPLYRVKHNDIGVMNANQIKQRKKLKRLLIWAMVLTFITQVTSTLYLLLLVYNSKVTNALFLIGLFDPAINIWTLWLMVTRNRQYVQSICCCTSSDEALLGRRHSVVLTDIPTRIKNVSYAQTRASFSPDLIMQSDQTNCQLSENTGSSL